jgi:hypothetical protein
MFFHSNISGYLPTYLPTETEPWALINYIWEANLGRTVLPLVH